MYKKRIQDHSEKIYKNIKALSVIRNIPMGIFESIVDVSPGYFSRQHQYAFNTVYNLAEYLGISVEDLVKRDYTKEAEKMRLKAKMKRLKTKMDKMQSDMDLLED